MNSQTKTNKLVIKSSPKTKRKINNGSLKNGRFGNRVFSYMYGRSYAEKVDLTFIFQVNGKEYVYSKMTDTK